VTGEVSPIGEISRNIRLEIRLTFGSFAVARSAADNRLECRAASLPS
jgi:hypothetical protein